MTAPQTTRIFRESDERQLLNIMKEAFGFSEEFWRWKHRLYPNFTPASITVAEKDGRIIGTSSWIPRGLKISSTLTIKSALGGDTAVDPRFRGQGIGSVVMDFFYKEALKNGIIVVSGFATPEVARKFYGPLGSILMKDSTTTYVKLMNSHQLRDRIYQAGEERSKQEVDSDGHNLAIKFTMIGAPPFLISLANGKIDLEEITETSTAKPNIAMSGELRVLIPFLKGEKGTWSLIGLVLTRKIRTKGLLRNAIRLIRLRKQLRAFLAPKENKSRK